MAKIGKEIFIIIIIIIQKDTTLKNHIIVCLRDQLVD
jgi:hypothetical protein